MIKLKYNKWEDISIKKFDEIRKALNANKNNELEANLELLSILCDVDVDEIEDLPLTEFSRLLKQTDFIAKMPKIDVKEKYVINGKKYNDANYVLDEQDYLYSKYLIVKRGKKNYYLVKKES